MKVFIVHIILLVSSLTLVAQQTPKTVKDSLLQAFEYNLQTASSDSLKLKALIEIAKYDLFRETEKSLKNRYD